MFKAKYYLSPVIILVPSFLSLFLASCGTGSQSVLPEAPPPYPDSPFASENQGSSINQPAPPNPQGRSYYERNRDSYSGGWNKSRSSPASTARSRSNYYSIEATSTIWVLIQDKFGNELQWVSLGQGQKVPISHSGPLTLTCSSGESLKITKPDGKPFHPAGKSKGITIIRIP